MSDSKNFKLICVTNRHLCEGDFNQRICALLTAGADAVILREKDLTETEYIHLSQKLFTFPQMQDISGVNRIILHHFPAAAGILNWPFIHLSLWQLEKNPEIRKQFSKIGVSVHSCEEALRAEHLGADYLTAGHIFDTECKHGLPGRGPAFLHRICASVSIPVFAIGGISPDNIADIKNTGASGACLMSSFMKCSNPQSYLSSLRSAVCKQ